MNAKHYIEHLDLKAHPEGGYYKEVYRSEGRIVANGNEFPSNRSYCTSIYFLLEENNFSALHRIRSDEIWHFYAGDPIEVIEITTEGKLVITDLGPATEKGQVFQYVVPAGNWFGSRVKNGGKFSLTGCTVAPGFDFKDFEMAERNELTQFYPEHSKIIKELTR